VKFLRSAVDRTRSVARRTTDRARSATRRLPRRKRPGLPPEGVVTIEYTPRLDGDPDPGEIVWTRVPFQDDPSQGKDRPVVVIGRRGTRLVGIPLTTKPDDREAQYKIGTGGWDPKRRTSYARIWRLVDIAPQSMRREGAILDAERFDALVRTVDRYYDVKLPAGDDAR
jgi:hypothetical protein